MKKIMSWLLICVMVLSLVACGGKETEETEEVTETEETKEEEETYSEFKWPDSDIAKLLPVPESNIGKIEWEAEYGLAIYVAETPKENYHNYVDACKDKGFTVDYQAGDDFYYAYNSDGYYTSLYYKDNDVMLITLDEPTEDTDSDAETEKDDDTKSEEIDDKDIRPEFKEAMDSYEKFFDEYYEFMKKYNDSDDTTSMMKDYTDYMSQYAETMKKMEALDDGELSTAEAAYYAEVTARITEKLADVY